MPRRSGAPSILPLLRSETQAGLLERIIAHPDQSYTVAELAELLEVTQMSVRRELDRMRRAGILEQQMVGRQGVYRASTASPLFTPLRDLVERSVGVEPLLREALEDVDGVEAAPIIGSLARGNVDAESDIDLLVIGDVDYPALVSKLMPLQRRVGREISIVWMRPGELRDALLHGSGFAAEIAASPRRALIGDLDDHLAPSPRAIP
jgi:predicted nucleotidyltransferase